MTQEVANANPLANLTPEQIMAAISGSAQETNARLYNYLAFSGKDGTFEINKNASNPNPEVMPSGTRLLVNVFESKKGYVCWKDGGVVDSFEQPIIGPPLPPVEALQNHAGPEGYKEREGWSKQFSLLFLDPETNKQYLFKTNSSSGVNSIGKFLQDFTEQGALHNPVLETPVVAISAENFMAGGYKNKKPIFTIVEWRATPTKAALPAATAPAQAALPAPDNTGAEDVPATRKKK